MRLWKAAQKKKKLIAKQNQKKKKKKVSLLTPHSCAILTAISIRVM
jgi:hypothetical protein